MKFEYKDVLQLNKVDPDKLNELFLSWFYEQGVLDKIAPKYCVRVDDGTEVSFQPSDPDIYYMLTDMILEVITHSGSLFMINDGTSDVGYISLTRNNLTIFITQSKRGQGYATKAIREMLPVLANRSNKYKYDPYTIMFLKDNKQSRALFEKLYGDKLYGQYLETIEDRFGRPVEVYEFDKKEFLDFD